MKSPTQETKCAKGVFQIQSPIGAVSFSNNISITQVRVNERQNLTRPLKPLNHELPPLHDLIIGPHVKHPPENLPKKVCFPMQSLFMKKASPYFVRGEEILCFIFKSIHISSSSLISVVQTITVQAKQPNHCF